MVFFNYATMQMAAKIVYYGPGLCGKTTNLHQIYAKTSPQSRGEMVSLETETDRTLFFDLLPIDVGVIGGFKTRLQLYTVPGQVFYNTTRKLVLKGADGIVFVADSQRAMLDANADSLRNLGENLAEIGLNLEEIPLVLQLNKRDLSTIASVDEMIAKLDPERLHEHVEAAALTGAGVFETLKTISKLTLRTLRRRMMGEEVSPPPQKSKSVFLVNSQAAEVKAPTPAEIHSHMPAAIIENAPASSASATAVASVIGEDEIETLATEAEIEPAPPVQQVSRETVEEEIDADFITDTPIADVPPAQNEPEDETIIDLEPPIEAEPATKQDTAIEDAIEQVDRPAVEPLTDDEASPLVTPQEPEEPEEPPFTLPPAEEPIFEKQLVIEREDEKPVKAVPEVKHVKVRSSIDIMAELELLRKNATSSTPKKREAPSIDFDSLRGRKDVTRNITLSADRSVVAPARRVRVAITFEDAAGEPLHKDEASVELDSLSDASALLVNLKLDLGSGQSGSGQSK